VELVDVSAMVEKIRNHRFDGYTDTGVATEIEKFRSGDGIGSIGIAVEALRAVAGALAETDVTLRRELVKLGVEWQSQAGGQAGQVFTEQAGFSSDATEKVDHSAEMIFAQGEAFSRTLYKLPDAATVRKGAGGFTLGDAALSLIGFETDHVRDVLAAKNARAQAVEALNAYAAQSGENLSSAQSLVNPQGLMLDSSAGGPGALDVAGSAVDLTPGGDKGETGGDTKAAHVEGPGKGIGPISHPAAKPHVAVPHDTPTPAMGIQAPRQSGSGAAPQPTAPSAGSTAPAASAPPAPSGGGSYVGGSSRNAAPQPGPGRPFGPFAPGAPGPAGSVPGGAATGAGFPGAEGTGGMVGNVGTPGKVGTPGGVGPRSGFVGDAGAVAGGAEQVLGKGKIVGSGPQAPTVPGQVGGPFVAVPKSGPAVGDLGAAAAAVGAGGVGGATSGEQERQGRGFGSGAAASGKPVQQLPLGELPEEEAAALRNSEKLSPRKETGKAGFLERAAPQDDEDAEYVRRFGIDDKDLFADQRMVSPDLIGDNGADETR
jgi:hypothetical protein